MKAITFISLCSPDLAKVTIWQRQCIKHRKCNGSDLKNGDCVDKAEVKGWQPSFPNFGVKRTFNIVTIQDEGKAHLIECFLLKA